MGIFWLVIAAVCLLAAVGILILRNHPDADRTAKGPMALMAGALIFIAVLTVFLDSSTVVPARNAGVVNSMGKAQSTLESGFHIVPPWASVETVDATVQNINLGSDTKDCITVRLANQTTACVDVTLQWNIDQHANANDLWQRYRGTNDNVVENIGINVVRRELRRAMNVVFESYNPLQVLAGGDKPSITTDALAARALEEMRAHVDPGIVVDKLLISLVHYDQVTQEKLDGYAQALANTQIATQGAKTAEQQKRANDLLAAASSSDPGVMWQNCLNMLEEMAAKDQLKNLPLAFTCGTANTPVILNQK